MDDISGHKRIGNGKCDMNMTQVAFRVTGKPTESLFFRSILQGFHPIQTFVLNVP